MMKKWGALEKWLKMTGDKPAGIAAHVCELIEQIFAHFEKYYVDAKGSIVAMKHRVVEAENNIISLRQQMEAMQHTMHQLANKAHKIEHAGDAE